MKPLEDLRAALASLGLKLVHTGGAEYRVLGGKKPLLLDLRFRESKDGSFQIHKQWLKPGEPQLLVQWIEIHGRWMVLFPSEFAEFVLARSVNTESWRGSRGRWLTKVNDRTRRFLTSTDVLVATIVSYCEAGADPCPSLEEIDRIAGGGGEPPRPPVKLKLVKNERDIRESVQRFNLTCRGHEQRAKTTIRQTSFWIYDPATGTYGPSKFVGFKGMDFPQYERAVNGECTGDRFDGGVTWNAVARVLQQDFDYDQQHHRGLIAWAEGLLGNGSLDNIDKSKWRFVELGKPEVTRKPWCLLAVPTVYDIENASQTIEEDTWTTPHGEALPGDRLIFWKTLGGTKRRGVVALGEVLVGPQMIPAHPDSAPFWGEGYDGASKRRITFRYVVPEKAPLWLADDASGLLAEMRLGKLQGDKLFKVDTDHWDQLVELLGGWPEADDGPTADPEELERRVQRLLRSQRGKLRRPRGQAKPKKRDQTGGSSYERDPEVKAWVLQEAQGVCECCGERGPFLTDLGVPFLEVHHVRWLSRGGPDVPENAVGICPNCHRGLHLGPDRESTVESLYGRVSRLIRP